MLNLWLTCGIICFMALQIFGAGDIGPGLYQVHHIKKCDLYNEVFDFDVQKKKINRTHDGYSGTVILDRKFTDEYAIEIDICKHVDGGCKQYQILADESCIHFIKKYAEKNVKTCLELAGIDPAEFPVEKGEYHVENYVFDYTELPKNGIYGLYGAMAYLLKDGQKVGCLELLLEFQKVKECEDEDCDDKK